MENKTITALKKSIEKHKRNALVSDPKEVRIGPTSCALCELFWWQDCKWCPVESFRCDGTPYSLLEVCYDDWHEAPDDKLARSKFVSATKAEVAFLESLLHNLNKGE